MNPIDIGSIQSAVTLFSFVAFVGIVAWAWSGRRRGEFSEASRIPLEDDRHDAAGEAAGSAREQR